ncbi:hypothetical protein LNV23_20545 [Paucibacter sp. DJ1R-11]|uniref:hypothetical protein n=1 Tax=Paucibacter sp. DJ1R-11 TaxID=2893556 RepID=UPI0021E3FE1A|nr:hypothetical protein [Paucibacter sp. DJ1R-11]MCV2365845.1 hypothetical protein [Paucibacter sp. DJ1R-11]
MQAIIQATSAFELRAELTKTPFGHSLRLISYVPTARRPEQQVKFQGLFTGAQLRDLRDLIDKELAT